MQPLDFAPGAEDNRLSTGEMRTEMLTRSIKFIDEHIGAK